MHSVSSPEFRGGTAGGFIKHGLERYEGEVEFFGELSGDFPHVIKFREPVVFDGSTFEDERFADYDLGVGKFFFGALEELAVAVLVLFNRAIVAAIEFVPDVVDSDQDAEEIRFYVDSVLLPACSEVRNFVTTDAPVVNLKFHAGVFAQKFSCNVGRIAATEKVIRFGFLFVTTCIGDGVALKEDGGTFFQFKRFR